MQTFLDGSINGAVYLSLGTNVNSMDLPANFCNTVLETFNELPYNLLWKLEDNGVVHNSSQVMVQEWFPQQDVLGTLAIDNLQ